MKQNMRDVLFSMELWYYGIRMIEGHFGSGVATYFRFLRWLFVMNVFVSIVILGFVVIPQALYSNHINNTADSIGFNFVDIFTGQVSEKLYFYFLN